MDNRLPVWLASLAIAQLAAGDGAAAPASARQACASGNRSYLARVVLAATLTAVGTLDEAAETLAEAYLIRPELSAEEIARLVGKRLAVKLLRLSRDRK